MIAEFLREFFVGIASVGHSKWVLRTDITNYKYVDTLLINPNISICASAYTYYII